MASCFGDDTFNVQRTICSITLAQQHETKARAENQAYACLFIEYNPKHMTYFSNHPRGVTPIDKPNLDTFLSNGPKSLNNPGPCYHDTRPTGGATTQHRPPLLVDEKFHYSVLKLVYSTSHACYNLPLFLTCARVVYSTWLPNIL